MSFHPSASTSANPLTSVTWNFGDGTTSFTNGSTLAAVQHTYATAGDYTVTLTVVDSSGNLAATTSVVSVGAAVTAGEAPPAATVATVRAPLLPSATTRGLTAADQPPVPGFAVTTAKPASGQPVHFSASASRATHGWIAAYRWSFGDGATSSGGAPSHTYARPGTYIVSLTVTDNRGASAGTARALAVALSGRITKVALSGGRTGAMMLAVSVDTAGTLTVGRRRFRLRHAGMARVLVNLTAAQRRSLRRTHKLRLRLTLRFAPAAGALSTGRSR